MCCPPSIAGAHAAPLVENAVRVVPETDPGKPPFVFELAQVGAPRNIARSTPYEVDIAAVVMPPPKLVPVAVTPVRSPLP